MVTVVKAGFLMFVENKFQKNKIAKSGESREHLFDVSEKLVLGTTENTEKRHCSLECMLQFTMGRMKMFT